LTQERIGGSGVIGVGPMSLGCTGALGQDASVVVRFVVASVSTRLMASSSIKRSRLFVVVLSACVMGLALFVVAALSGSYGDKKKIEHEGPRPLPRQR